MVNFQFEILPRIILARCSHLHVSLNVIGLSLVCDFNVHNRNWYYVLRLSFLSTTYVSIQQYNYRTTTRQLRFKWQIICTITCWSFRKFCSTSCHLTKHTRILISITSCVIFFRFLKYSNPIC